MEPVLKTTYHKEINPLFTNILFPGDMNLKDITLIDITIPNDKPPINISGIYTFAILAAKTGTTDFISNLSIVSFVVEWSWNLLNN